MRETVQAPVSRETLGEWAEDRYGAFMNVRADNDKVLTLHNDTLFPEISVLFIGEADNFNDTVEICGMYDKRAREFRFISDRLASIVDGVSEMERWTGVHTSEDIYARISGYAKEAVEAKGYRFQNEMDEQFAEIRQDAQVALPVMAEYAAVLAARGEKDAVLDVRDLAVEMLHFWRDMVYLTYERGYEKVERQYLEGFDQTVATAIESGQAPAFDSGKAHTILQGLAIHAVEVTDNEDAFSVWECCRLAKRIATDHPDQCAVFNGDFTADYSERFTRFGSQDWQRLQEGWLLDRPILLFNHPVPDDQVPEGWHSYHLAGRNLHHLDRLLKAEPESGYVGTVLSPHVLIRASYQSRQLPNPCGSYSGYVSLEEFCEKHHLPQPDMSGIDFGQQEQAAAPQMGREWRDELMKDLFQSTVARDDFQRWLELGTAPLMSRQGEKITATLLKLEKNSSVDYLYQTAAQDDSVSWSNPVLFCGVYDRKNRALYLTKDAANLFMKGQFPFVAEAGPPMTDEIGSSINRRVEDIIANDRNNLAIQEVTGWQASRDLEYYRDHGAKESAVRQIFSNQEPDGQFHSDYKLDELPETAFIAYITDPELFVQTEAGQYIKNNQEKFLLQFLKTDALLAEYQALMQDAGNPIHRMKAITDAIKGCGAKTVTVTVQKDGQELTFKAAADSLTGHRNYYSTSEIPASDRREFERLFGRYTDYNAEDVVKITYGRNTIYEAPAAPTEEMGPVMQMGGM